MFNKLMKTKFTNFMHLREVFLFAVPIISGQIGQMLFGIGDIFVAGFYSSVAVSAIGVGSSIFSAFLVTGFGVLFCTGPLASQNRGANREDPNLLFNIFLVCVINSVLLILLLNIFANYIQLIGLNPEIEPFVAQFLKITSYTILPALISQATKEYLQAHGKTYFPNALIIIFNLINLGLGFLFVFGFGRFSGIGIIGVAIATLVCRFLMAFILIATCFQFANLIRIEISIP